MSGYAFGYSDPRSIYSVAGKITRLYGTEHKKMSYTESLASSMKNLVEKTIGEVFVDEYNKISCKYGKEGSPVKKIDAHGYTTEAKDLDIEVIKNIWLVKYGNEPVNETELVKQDDFTWECGNRLYWAGILETVESIQTFHTTYICKS
jgi:hypothetical protein